MSAKIKDNKNRWRNKTVGFRVSPEEWEEIERLVSLSGMSKQEYIMHRLQNTEMVIQANPRVVKALRNEIRELHKQIGLVIELEISDVILEQMKFISHMVSKLIITE